WGVRVVGGDQVAERQAGIDDRADDRGARGHRGRRRHAQVDAYLVVSERVPELLDDGGGELVEVQLPEDAPGDLTKNGELGDAQQLLSLLTPRLLFQVVGLLRQRA